MNKQLKFKKEVTYEGFVKEFKEYPYWTSFVMIVGSYIFSLVGAIGNDKDYIIFALIFLILAVVLTIFFLMAAFIGSREVRYVGEKE